MRERHLGSTLVVIAFCLVLATGIFPWARRVVATTADQRAQTWTVADVDYVGRAMFSWLTDQVGAAAAGQSQVPVDLTRYPQISHADLSSILSPQYIRHVPEKDGWAHSYELRLNTTDPLAQEIMAVRSPGRDGSFSGSSYVIGRFDSASFDEDIVWADGFFVRRPDGLTGRHAQELTFRDIQSIGHAMISWLVDQVSLAATRAQEGTEASSVQFDDYPGISYEDLNNNLVPQYLRYLPERDGWGQPYDFRLDTANPLAENVIAVRSPGQDGDFSGSSYAAGTFDPDNFGEDIAWADGSFVRSPGSRTDREAQQRTTADIRNIGTALFSWLTDQIGLTAGRAPGAVTSVTLDNIPEISHTDLSNLLVPQYMNSLPELDGWNHPYEFRLDTADPFAEDIMAVRSPGKDGVFSESSYSVSSFDGEVFEDDIVWANGFFVRWPETLDGLPLYTIPPCRVFDTRPTSALQSGATDFIPLAGACGIPTSAKAVVMNVTVIGPTGAGHVTLFPGGLPAPSTTTINFASGQTRASNAILGLSENGAGAIGAHVSMPGGGQVHLALDVSGYFE